MIQNPYFYNLNIDGEHYLIPFGPEFEERRHFITLNGTSLKIWNALEKRPTQSELEEMMISEFEATEEGDKFTVRNDVKKTINILKIAYAVLESEEDVQPAKQSEYAEYKEREWNWEEIINLPTTTFLNLREEYGEYSLQRGFLFIHSASVLYKEKLWLFSAKSGTGKSTHANMWQQAGTGKVINGDLNLVGIKNGEASVKGTPWCGTSGIYDLNEYPLGGIAFLVRDESDFVEELPFPEKVVAILRESITPMWDKEKLEKEIEIALQIAKQSVIFKLHCTAKLSAYEKAIEYIDCH